MSTLSATLLILSALLFGQAAPARNDNGAQSRPPDCAEPVYKMEEVTTKPRIISKTEPGYTEEARRNKVGGRVVVEAVLCKTGKVTDVVVLKGLPNGLNEQALKAARRIKFEPGEKDGEQVSVRIRVIYGFEIY